MNKWKGWNILSGVGITTADITRRSTKSDALPVTYPPPAKEQMILSTEKSVHICGGDVVLCKRWLSSRLHWCLCSLRVNEFVCRVSKTDWSHIVRGGTQCQHKQFCSFENHKGTLNGDMVAVLGQVDTVRDRPVFLSVRGSNRRLRCDCYVGKTTVPVIKSKILFVYHVHVIYYGPSPAFKPSLLPVPIHNPIVVTIQEYGFHPSLWQ